MANLAALRAAIFSLSAKNLRGGADNHPPAVRGLKTAPLVAFPVNPFCSSKSAKHDVTLTSLTADLL